MSDDARDRFEIPKEMRSMAEASFEQARKTFEKFVASAQAAAGTIEERNATVAAGARDVSGKAMAYAEQNMAATFEFAEKLMQAKDATEVMRLQSDYLGRQMQALSTQAQELGQSAAKMMVDAGKPRP